MTVPGQGSAKSDLNNCRVLLAEDDPDHGPLLSLILAKAGAQVTVAKNGAEAVEMAEEAYDDKRPFDIILMDMQMPVLDGYGATQKIKQTDSETPILAVTARAFDKERNKCFEVGCDDFIAKPVETDKLISSVATQLKKTSADFTGHQPKC